MTSGSGQKKVLTRPGQGRQRHFLPRCQRAGRRQLADQRDVGDKTAPFAIDFEAIAGQGVAQGHLQFHQGRRHFTAGPQQMVVLPVAQPVQAEVEGGALYAGGDFGQLGQARFRHLAEKGQGQVDCCAARGPSAEARSRIVGNYGQAVSDLGRRPEGEENAGRCRPFA